MDKSEARARLIALAQNTPKGPQREALIMGANALIDDIANQWLKKHDEDVKKDGISQFIEYLKNNWRIEQATVILEQPSDLVRIGRYLVSLTDIIAHSFFNNEDQE